MCKQAVAHSYALDGVLTLVDAKHIGQHLDEQKPDGVVNEALSQVAYADRIILNKTDLVRFLASATSYILLLPARLKERGCTCLQVVKASCSAQFVGTGNRQR